MPIHEQRIIRFGFQHAEAAARRLAAEGAPAVARHGGRLFGVFRPVIGLSQRCVVVITEWPDEAAAMAHGAAVLAGVADGTEIEHDLWEPTARPLPGEVPEQTSGFYSHRAFDIRPEAWPRFFELSADAWASFEGTHASVVAGFWKARTAPAPGLLRVRLMAWYESLDAWERSRFWSARLVPGSEDAQARFRERHTLLEDNQVAILMRVP